MTVVKVFILPDRDPKSYQQHTDDSFSGNFFKVYMICMGQQGDVRLVGIDVQIIIDCN